MKRLVLALTLAGVLGATVQPAMAQYGYAPGYSYASNGYGYASGYQGHPVLRNLLIAGGSFGLGFVAGRATAPQYGGYGYGVPGGYRPAYGHVAPWGGHHW